MSPSATPATQKCRGVTRDQGAPKPVQARHPVPSCPTPATQNDGSCEFVPRLPRRTNVNVAKCHACHTETPRRHARPRRAQASPSAPPRAIRPTPATQNDGRCEFVPRLPRRTNVNVTKCHACHAEMPRRHARSRRAQASPSAPPRAICPTPATQNDGRCEFVPRLPRRTNVNVAKCRACHAEMPRRHARPRRAQASPSAPPSAICPGSHACHAKRR